MTSSSAPRVQPCGPASTTSGPTGPGLHEVVPEHLRQLCRRRRRRPPCPARYPGVTEDLVRHAGKPTPGTARPRTGSVTISTIVQLPGQKRPGSSPGCRRASIRLPSPVSAPGPPRCSPARPGSHAPGASHRASRRRRRVPREEGRSEAGAEGGLGSVTPRSVPATLAVYPERKWYMACSGVSRADGREHPEGRRR